MMPSARAVPIETRFVASDGASLAVYAAGPRDDAAPPLVFLHAGVSDGRLWADQFETFGRSRRVVAYDRRGYGATAAVDERFANVDDLWAVLDALSVQRAVLIGCSQGGRIALDAALERPERVAALVLVAAAIGGAPAAPDDPRLQALIAAAEAAAASADVDAQNRIAAHVWLDGPFAPEGRVGGSRRDLFLAMNRIVLEGPKLGTPIVPDTAYARLAEVAVPTLVVWGPLDVPGAIANMRHAAATIPGARAVEIAGVAHLPSLEAPERFDAVLGDFLQDAGHA